jgi:hypothetical protein
MADVRQPVKVSMVEQMRLARRVANLEAALREADDRLRELGDTSMHPVRDRIYRLIGQRIV